MEGHGMTSSVKRTGETPVKRRPAAAAASCSSAPLASHPQGSAQSAHHQTITAFRNKHH